MLINSVPFMSILSVKTDDTFCDCATCWYICPHLGKATPCQLYTDWLFARDPLQFKFQGAEPLYPFCPAQVRTILQISELFH